MCLGMFTSCICTFAWLWCPSQSYIIVIYYPLYLVTRTELAPMWGSVLCKTHHCYYNCVYFCLFFFWVFEARGREWGLLSCACITLWLSKLSEDHLQVYSFLDYQSTLTVTLFDLQAAGYILHCCSWQLHLSSLIARMSYRSVYHMEYFNTMLTDSLMWQLENAWNLSIILWGLSCFLLCFIFLINQVFFSNMKQKIRNRRVCMKVKIEIKPLTGNCNQ